MIGHKVSDVKILIGPIFSILLVGNKTNLPTTDQNEEVVEIKEWLETNPEWILLKTDILPVKSQSLDIYRPVYTVIKHGERKEQAEISSPVLRPYGT